MDGITLVTFQSWMHDSSLTSNDLRTITQTQVADLYQDCYWNPINGTQLPAGVDLMVWDMAVNAGVSASAKLVQSIVAVAMDGDIGLVTLEAIRAFPPLALIDDLATQQTTYYRSLGGFAYFGVGWLRRVDLRKAAAVALANGALPASSKRIGGHPVAPSDQPPPGFWQSLSASVKLRCGIPVCGTTAPHAVAQ